MQLTSVDHASNFSVLVRKNKGFLGGSWLLISRVISRVTMVMTLSRVLIAPTMSLQVGPDLARKRLGFKACTDLKSPGSRRS